MDVESENLTTQFSLILFRLQTYALNEHQAHRIAAQGSFEKEGCLKTLFVRIERQKEWILFLQECEFARLHYHSKPAHSLNSVRVWVLNQESQFFRKLMRLA